MAAKPSDEVAAGTLGSIFRQAGIEERIATREHLGRGVRTNLHGMERLRASVTWAGRHGATRPEVEQAIRDGIPLHLEGLAEDGLPIPDPASVEAEAVAV